MYANGIKNSFCSRFPSHSTLFFWRERNCCELKTIFYGYHMGARGGVQDAGTNMEGTLRGWGGGGGGGKAKGDVD